jgi:hypothetical protein
MRPARSAACRRRRARAKLTEPSGSVAAIASKAAAVMDMRIMSGM